MADTIGEFLVMGGYARYVWGSYGIFALVMIVNVVLPVRRGRRVREELRREYRFEAGSR